jgi:hypothetical protein
MTAGLLPTYFSITAWTLRIAIGKESRWVRREQTATAPHEAGPGTTDRNHRVKET